MVAAGFRGTALTLLVCLGVLSHAVQVSDTAALAGLPADFVSARTANGVVTITTDYPGTQYASLWQPTPCKQALMPPLPQTTFLSKSTPTVRRCART